MKQMKLILTFVFILSTATLFAKPEPTTTGEKYTVIMTKGVIFNSTQKKAVTRGTTINATDKVIFKSKDAKAIMLSATRGRFLMAPKTTGSELVAFVSNVVSPLKTNSKLSTRGKPGEAILNLKDYLGTSTFAIIGDKLKMTINTSQFPMDDHNFFAWVYQYNGHKVQKKVAFDKDGVVTIDKDTYLAKVEDGDQVDVSLYYIKNYKLEGYDRRVEAKFTPVYINQDSLLNIFEDMKKTYEDNEIELSNDEWYSEFTNYMYNSYGNVDKYDLYFYLLENKLIKKVDAIEKDLKEEGEEKEVKE